MEDRSSALHRQDGASTLPSSNLLGSGDIEAPSPSDHATPSLLLQLPPDVWSQIVSKQERFEQEALTLTTHKTRSLVAPSAVTSLTISQRTMTQLPPHLAHLPAAFTAFNHLTLDLTGMLFPHTLPFLRSFQQHCSAALTALTSLKLLLNRQVPRQLGDQLATLLASCQQLAKLELEIVITHAAQSHVAINFTLKEHTPGAGLHHLSHCFEQLPPDNSHPDNTIHLDQHLVSLPAFIHHLICLNANSRPLSANTAIDAPWLQSALPHLPALQELLLNTFMPPLTLSLACATFTALTGLTRLALTLCRSETLTHHTHHIFNTLLPSMTALKDLNVESFCDEAEQPQAFVISPAWSSLQSLTKLTMKLGECTIPTNSGLWALSNLQQLEIQPWHLPPTDYPGNPSHLPSTPGLHSLVSLQGFPFQPTPIVSHPVGAFRTLPRGITRVVLSDFMTTTDQGADPEHLPIHLPNLSTLSTVCLTLKRRVVQAVARMSSVRDLDICAIYGLEEGLAGDTLALLCSMTQLTSLGYCCPLKACRVPPELVQLTRLQHLRLSCQRVQFEPGAALPCSLTCLHYDVEDSCVHLPACLKECKSLRAVRVAPINVNPGALTVTDPAGVLPDLTSLRKLHLVGASPGITSAVASLSLLTSLNLRATGTDVSSHHVSLPLHPAPALHHIPQLKSLQLDMFSTLPPTLPPSVTKFTAELRASECTLLPQQWECAVLQHLEIDGGPAGISGAPALAPLAPSLQHLVIAGVKDGNLNQLDALTRLTYLEVRPQEGCEVSVWLPEVKAAAGPANVKLEGCTEVPRHFLTLPRPEMR